MSVIIYTDGSAKGNPGNGGYGVVLISGIHRKEISEGYRLTTNNRMELLAVIDALKKLKKSILGDHGSQITELYAYQPCQKVSLLFRVVQYKY